MGAAMANDLSSAARIRRTASNRIVVKLTDKICVSALSEIDAKLVTAATEAPAVITFTTGEGGGTDSFEALGTFTRGSEKK